MVSVAIEYQGRGLPLTDLISAGNRGLLVAAGKFDGARGVKFISYAVWWIRQSIRLCVAEDTRMVRLPYNQISLLNKIAKMSKDAGPQPIPEALAEELGATLDAVNDSLAWSRDVAWLDAPISKDNSLLNLVADTTQAAPDAAASENSERRYLSRVMEALEDREAEVVRLYFGIDEDEPWTLAEIGARFHVSRERVRQIKEKALTKLRHPTRRVQLEALMELA